MLIADQINKDEKQKSTFEFGRASGCAVGAGFDSVRVVCEVGDIGMFAASLSD
jgi:hypothetical protein